MKKKQITILTFVLAGAMVLGGTGGLFESMSRAQKKEAVIQVERIEVENTDISLSKKNASDKKVWQKEQGFYLPEDAVIEGKKDGNYIISWNDYDIIYRRDKSLESEKKTDIGMGKAISIVSETVKKYSNQDMSGAKLEIYLLKNTDSEGKENVDNTKNYGVRKYKVCVEEVNKHSYWIEVNSLTGEVIEYSDFYEVYPSEEEIIQNRVIYDGYTESELGYGPDKNATDEEVCEFVKKSMEEAKKVYEPIAKKFVKEKLQLGEVKEIFVLSVGEMMGMDGSRDTLVLHCQTENQDVVKIQIDQITKTVREFSINPLYY